MNNKATQIISQKMADTCMLKARSKHNNTPFATFKEDVISGWERQKNVSLRCSYQQRPLKEKKRDCVSCRSCHETADKSARH